MSLNLDITIVIPTKNEEKNLPGCLTSIGPDLATRVVVLDSGSIDQTVAIAHAFDAEVVNFTWDGKFPKKRNWFLRNYKFTTGWVLFLDADEYITESFKSELRKALERNDRVGYWLCYTVYFLGKKLKGGYPLRKLAVFRTNAGEYERIEEDQWSQLDMEVHEHPILTGQVGVIYSKIDHQDFRGVSHYVSKHSDYACWEAARFLKLTNTATNSIDWTWKQKLKYSLVQNVLFAPAYFFGSFFLMGGFLDGATGLSFALLKMSYFTQIYCEIREMKLRN